MRESCEQNEVASLREAVDRQLAAIQAKLEQVDQAIRGNGKPGIQLRLDRLERAEASRSRLLWLIAGSGVTLAGTNLWNLLFGS